MISIVLSIKIITIIALLLGIVIRNIKWCISFFLIAAFLMILIVIYPKEVIDNWQYGEDYIIKKLENDIKNLEENLEDKKYELQKEKKKLKENKE